MNITPNEANLLRAIALHEMNTSNGAEPESWDEVATYCWCDEFAGDCHLTVPQVKGVLSSLVKKGWVTCEDYDDADGLVAFTESGYETYDHLRGSEYYS